MNQMNFLPDFYIEMKAKKKSKKYILLNIILLLFITLIFMNISINKDKILLYDNQIKKIKDEALKNKKTKSKNIIRKFNYIYSSKEEGIELNEIYMKKDEIVIQGKCSNMSCYYKFIDRLEKGDKLVMKSIIPPKNEEGNSNFKMILE